MVEMDFWTRFRFRFRFRLMRFRIRRVDVSTLCVNVYEVDYSWTEELLMYLIKTIYAE